MHIVYKFLPHTQTHNMHASTHTTPHAMCPIILRVENNKWQAFHFFQFNIFKKEGKNIY